MPVGPGMCQPHACMLLLGFCEKLCRTSVRPSCVQQSAGKACESHAGVCLGAEVHPLAHVMQHSRLLSVV